MPTAFMNPSNDAISQSQLDIDTTPGVVDVHVGASDGAKFGTAPFPIKLDNEIMLCTSRTDDILTCSRAQEGTSIQAHTAGITVALTITAKYLSDLQTAVNTLENSGSGSNAFSFFIS